MKGNSLSVMTAFVMMSASVTGCALSDDGAKESQRAAALDSAFTLNLSTETAPQDKVHVTSSDGSPARDCFGTGCQFAYLAGSVLTLTVTFPTDTPNCIFFSGWSGACSGQGNPCTLTLNSDLTTEALWSPIIGCDPE